MPSWRSVRLISPSRPGCPEPAGPVTQPKSELPTLLLLMVLPTKAVFRAKRQLWRTPLLGATLWLGVCLQGGSVMARPAAAPPDPQPVEPREPGASDLLGDEPLQLGLMQQGLPLPAASPPEPLPAASPPDSPDAGPTTRPPAKAEPPAGTTPAGTVPARVVPAVDRRLVLDRRRKVLRVFDGPREVRRYPVAVGMPGWETPVGQFSVLEKRANPTWEHPASGHLLPPGPANPLGSRWIGFYRDCRGRSGFNGQEHLVVKGCVTAGFHGTPNRRSVGRAVSHGCVRLFDEHAKELFDLVSLGTPVTVLP